MDTNNTRMGSNIQNDLRNSYRYGNNGGEYYFKHSGNIVRGSGRNNRFKMAETLKLLDILGFTMLVMGFLANLGNVVSVTAGAVGIAWGVIRCLRAYEEYRIKKIERMERENGYRRDLHKAKEFPLQKKPIK